MKHLLLGFDYELFLGRRSGTADACLLTPADKILDVLAKHKAKAMFFIDTTYLIQLRKLAHLHEHAALDYHRIRIQIQKIARRGHYIFPHMHPHWLDARYMPEENQWDLSNNRRYRFHHLNLRDREYVFQESVNILKEILFPVNSSYVPEGYRAGGWCIQPFGDFKPFFQKYGILYDFSVLRGKKCLSASRFFNFCETEVSDYYSFSEDVLNPEPGIFAEFTISGIRYSFLIELYSRIYMKILPIRKKSNFGNGLSLENSPILTAEAPSLLSAFTGKTEMISIELLNGLKMHEYVRYFKSNPYMHFISHPKMISPHNLKAFDFFLSRVLSMEEVNFDFKNILVKDLRKAAQPVIRTLIN